MKKWITWITLSVLTSQLWAMDCTNMWAWLTKACELSNEINDQGKHDLYLSGWSWHNRNRYPAHKIENYQEFAYGAGVGRSLINDAGNEHNVFGMALADSHNKPQLIVGYTYQAYWNIVGELKAGVGYSLGLTSRRDIIHNIPFPYLLPVISAKFRAVTIYATYVPNLNGGENGDVAFVFGRYTF